VDWLCVALLFLGVFVHVHVLGSASGVRASVGCFVRWNECSERLFDARARNGEADVEKDSEV